MVKKKDIEKRKKKLSKKEIQNKQIMWTVVLGIGIILIVVLVPFITKNYINKFVYIDLDFQKTRLGELIFYSTKIPIADINGQIVESYTMNFRSNPKKSDKIKYNKEFITLKKENIVYITLDKDMESCDGDNTIALMNLAGFLKDFVLLNVSSAITDEDYAIENNMSYVTCENTKNNTVIWLTGGEETQINKIGKNCYEISYSDCEIIPVTEKFMLIMMENYMRYFTRVDKSILDWFK